MSSIYFSSRGKKNMDLTVVKAETLGELSDHLEENGVSLPWIYRAIQRITQRSVKFIRWLRNHLDSQAS